MTRRKRVVLIALGVCVVAAFGAAVLALQFVRGRPLSARLQRYRFAIHRRLPPSTEASMAIRCDQPSYPVSPLIFGVGGDSPEDMGATARRFGGNPTSRYNWELGNAWNTANDWFFRNVKLSYSYQDIITDAAKRGQVVAITVPMLGWVAKDRESFSFPVSVFGPQQDVDPWKSDAGNGVTPDGKRIEPGPPERTSERMPPERVAKWVRHIRDDANGRVVKMYVLDNEPFLWHDTHRDVHPKPATYDELVERTIQYGTAVRKAAPDALIAGPALWGWPAYFYSAADAVAGFREHPDRSAHGDVPFLAYYLRALREHEERTHVRILDVVDVHYYPQNDGMFSAGGGGWTDDYTSEVRVRATRSLWDEDYIDESWIREDIRLIPRLAELIRDEYPGRKISIGEWNFGAEKHHSAALAVAESLGRFAQFGVHSAFYWTSPEAGAPAYFGFRSFRNYDGTGGHFLEQFVPSEAAVDTSIFASTNATKDRIVAVLINRHAHIERRAEIELRGCRALTGGRRFDYADKAGFREAKLDGSTPVTVTLPPFGLSVIELSLR